MVNCLSYTHYRNANLEAKLLEKKNAPYKLTVEDTQNDDNTIVEMTEKRMEELKLMRGDQVLIKGKGSLN